MAEILKSCVNDCFKINSKQMMKMSEKGEDNGKQDLYESYTIKYRKQVACGCDNKLVCIDDKFVDNKEI